MHVLSSWLVLDWRLSVVYGMFGENGLQHTRLHYSGMSKSLQQFGWQQGDDWGVTRVCCYFLCCYFILFYLCDALFLSQENIPCPPSPEKLKPTKSKRLKQGKYIFLRSFYMYDYSLKMFLQFSIVFVEQVPIVWVARNATVLGCVPVCAENGGCKLSLYYPLSMIV